MELRPKWTPQPRPARGFSCAGFRKMPATATSPDARLRKLRSALERAKNVDRREVRSAKPMADLIGVSWPVLRGWCDDIPGFEDSGAFARGGNGIEWEFSPLATVMFLVRHFENVIAHQIDRARKEREEAGLKESDGIPAHFDPARAAKTVDLRTKVDDAMVRQGRLTDAAKARSILNRLFSDMKSAGYRALHEADPNGRWSPETRVTVETVTREIIRQQERAAQIAVKELNGGIVQSG